MNHLFSVPDGFKIVGLEETKRGFVAHVRERNKLGPLGFGLGASVMEAFEKASADLTKRLRDMPTAVEPSAPAALSGLKLDLSRLHGVKK